MFFKLKQFEIFVRQNLSDQERVSVAKVWANSKRSAINKYCSSNNGVWVSAKEL